MTKMTILCKVHWVSRLSLSMHYRVKHRCSKLLHCMVIICIT